MARGARLLGLSLGCLCTGALAGGDEALPDEHLLEFLGSWADQAVAEDWLEIPGGDASGAGREPTREGAGDGRASEHEAGR